MDKIICQICKKQYDNYRSLSLHIKNKHKLEPKDYYDKYLKKKNEDLCEVCRNNTNWVSMSKGYNRFCSNLCVSKSKSVQSKREKTNLKRYGSTNSSKVEKFKEKRKNTKIKRYGYEYGFENKEFKTKAEQTMIDKYGTSNINKLDDIKKKIKDTNLKRYGTINPTSNEQIKKRIKNTNLKRYGYEWGLMRPEIIKKARNNFQKNKKNIILKLRKQNLTNGYNLLKSNLKNKGLNLLCDIDNYNGTYDIHTMKRYYYNLECKECGHIFNSSIAFGELPSCPKCNPKKIMSNPEFEIFSYITDELNISKEEIMQSDRSGIAGRSEHNNSPKELDLYLPKYKFAIEYDGLYWHSEKYLDKNYHLDKTKSCESNGIQLLHIFENEWLNPIKKDIWKSIISTKLNMNKRVYARKCSITEINSKQSMNFLNNNHLQGGAGAKYHIGLFYNNELISVATFGKPRFNKNYEFELVRFANKKFISVIGGFSKLLKYFERIYNPSSIITYADRRISSGNLYEKTGFKFLRDTNPNYFYINEMELESRIKFQKHKLKNLLEDFNPDLSEHENMLNHGIFRIYDVGNKVYEKRID
jgi:predicted Zn-ribbon and HTH transcriptional regulator